MNEKWEPISKKHKILVSREHNFNTDTILLAAFSAPKKHYVCADFGCGCGTIGLLWKIRQNPEHIFAVDLQEQACRQVEESVKENNFTHFDVFNENINDYEEIFNSGELDLIACNPPYKEDGTGIKNANSSITIARHEQELSLKQLAKAARYCLKYGGKIYICHRPERLSDIMNIFRENGLEPKSLRLVQQRIDKRPFLVMLECRRGGKAGLDVLPTLIIEQDGEYSKEMLEIYGDYKDGCK